MYETLKRLYNEGRLTENGLSKAVEFEWITQEEKETIISGE